MKRTELRRGQPLRADAARTRDWQQRSRRRLPVRSARRAAEASKRRAVVREVIARDGGCVGAQRLPEVQCQGPLDGHEPGLRSRGADYLDPEQVVCLCRAHHDFVHLHRSRGEAVGLLV